jgi:hypothetical protein
LSRTDYFDEKKKERDEKLGNKRNKHIKTEGGEGEVKF